MAKKALIVVDVQNDFCPGGSLAVPNGDQVVEPINKLTDYARAHGWVVVFSLDWHPRNSKHFAENGGKWPVHCVKETHGAQFHPNLNYKGLRKRLVWKGMDPENDGGYSAFEGTGGLGDIVEPVPLKTILQAKVVREVYVCGLATDYCVKATALDAVRNGFKTFLLLDACRAVNINPGDGDKAIEEMKAAGVAVTTTDAVLSGRG